MGNSRVTILPPSPPRLLYLCVPLSPMICESLSGEYSSSLPCRQKATSALHYLRASCLPLIICFLKRSIDSIRLRPRFSSLHSRFWQFDSIFFSSRASVFIVCQAGGCVPRCSRFLLLATMTSLEHQSFARDHLIEDMFLPQHPTPMSMSAPSGISISISSNVTYEDEHWHHDHSSSFQTPKALGPYHDQMTIFPIQHYHHDESYTLSSAPTSARGRSLSGTSTDSVTYSVASPRTTPPVPCLFNGASIQFSAGHDEAVSETDGAGSSSQEHLSSPLLKQEPPCSQDGQESSSSSDK